jgi:putative addiction module killer protein
MMEIRETETSRNWFAALSDSQARHRIDTRIRRLSLGNPGDVAPVGEGISEMRIFTARAIGCIIKAPELK